jgi:SAM-dependent methyltransferase
MKMAYTQSHSPDDYLKLLAQLVAQYKQRTYELMEVAPGSQVLDVGCGPGTDTIPLARLTGPAGHVVGIDIDERMIALADARAEEAGVQDWVEHRHSTESSLPLAADVFDSSRSERVFQHAESPSQLLREMIRVTKPGWRIVVLDTDWSTMSIDTDLFDIEQRIKRYSVENRIRNGCVGRSLFRMFRECGLEDVAVEMMPTYLTDYQVSRKAITLDDAEISAVAAGVITQSELELWHSDLERSAAQGTYFFSIQQMLVSGCKPAHHHDRTLSYSSDDE